MPTLSLAMIVKNEEEVLGRCLDSCHELFDQIVIVDTGSDDRTVEIAKSYPNVEIHNFKWINDFAAARNFSFEKCTCEYVMWLDADDVIKDHDLPRFKELKETMIQHCEAVLLPYEYAHDANDNSLLTLYRHRIVKNGVGCVWEDRIHEYLKIPHHDKVMKADMPVHHYRTEQGVAQDGSRNLQILEEIIAEKGKVSGRNLFYYAKELYYTGNFEKAASTLEDYLELDIHDWSENKKAGYGLLPECYRLIGKHEESLRSAKRAVKEAGDRVDGYMELAYALHHLGRTEEATVWLEKACEIEKPDTLAPITNEKYSWLPHQQLVLFYDRLRKYGDAYLHTFKVLQYKPDHKDTRYNIDYLTGKIREELDSPIGWIDHSPREWGPSRLRQYHIREALNSLGIETKMVTWEDPSDCKVVIRRWNQPDDMENIKKLQEKGIKVVLDLCEDLFDLEGYKDPIRGATSQADLVVCCSSVLAQRAKTYNNNVLVIEDPHENLSYEPKTHTEKNDLWAVFCGYGGSYENIRPYESIIRECGYKILTIHEHEENYGDKSYKWDLANFQEKMLEADVALCLANYKEQPGKSNNRMTQAKALGLPVICSPLRSYTENTRHGYDGFLVSNEQEIRQALISLKDPKKREEISKNGVLSAVPYRVEIIAMKWAAAANKLLKQEELPLRRVNLGIIPLPEWENKIPDSDQPIQDLALGIGSISHLHMSYVMEHYPQSDMLSMAKLFYDSTQESGKVTVIFTDVEQAIDEYKKGRISFEKLSERCFQNGSHKSIASLGYMSDLFQRAGFSEVHELSLQEFPFTIVPDMNNPVPEPMQSGLICWKNKRSMEKDPDQRFAKEIKLPQASAVSQEGTVDLVIPIYNCLDYTKACVESILECTDHPYKLILVNAGSTDPQVRPYLDNLSRENNEISVIHLERATFSEAVNMGVISGKSPHACIMNNDIIVSRGWLKKMVETLDSDVGTVGPWSNCDYGWKHKDELTVEGIRLHPDMVLEEFDGILPKLYDAKYQDHKEIVECYQGGFNAFYCTLIPRGLFSEVGYLDENFRNGGEDSDWCYRASALGYKHLMRKDCFVFHFGAKTRKRREDEDYEKYHQEDMQNNLALRAKWQKPRLTIFTGQAWEKWNPESINKGGIGGSETAVIKIADSFNKLGYEVFVFNDCRDLEGDYDGVKYLHWEKYPKWALTNHSDIFISSRMVQPLDLPICTGGRYVWVHDIWLAKDKIDLRLDKVDKFLCLSPWHKEFFCQHHECPEDKVIVTTNGIDPGRFKGLDWEKKKPYKFVYSSSPDRGLDCLLEMWPLIRTKYPEAELHVFYGFYNWMSSIKSRNDQHQLQWAESIMEALKQPGVVNHDRVGQQELADHYMEASVWLMPEPFTETNCITAKEAMAAGCMPICSDVAALKTTVGDRGLIVPFGDWRMAYSLYKRPEVKEKFLCHTIDFLDNREKYQEKLLRNREEMLTSGSWDCVAKNWHEQMFKQHLFRR